MAKKTLKERVLSLPLFEFTSPIFIKEALKEDAPKHAVVIRLSNGMRNEFPDNKNVTVGEFLKGLNGVKVRLYMRRMPNCGKHTADVFVRLMDKFGLSDEGASSASLSDEAKAILAELEKK